MVDQRGCLSPSVIYLGKNGSQAFQFGACLAKALEDLSLGEGSPTPNFERILLARSLSDSSKIKKIQGKACHVWESSKKGAWALFYDEEPDDFSLTPGGQTVILRGFDRLDSVYQSLKPMQPYLQAAALEASLSEKRKIAQRLALLGVSRLCRAGEMQNPPIVWHHDGMKNLASWVRWTDLEL